VALSGYGSAGGGPPILGRGALSIPESGPEGLAANRRRGPAAFPVIPPMPAQAPSQWPNHWTMQLALLFLIGSLLSAQVPAGVPGPWAGGAPVASAPAAPGSRTAEPSLDLSLPQPGPVGSANRGRGAGPWHPDPDSPPGSQGVGSWGALGSPGEGFRFRGDKALQQVPGVESPHAPGYRFRPLTPAEQERSEDVSGWRPLGRDGHRSQAPVQEGPSGNDAYGYQSDSWFRKYYGDRP
jgi:hypothetical protein